MGACVREVRRRACVAGRPRATIALALAGRPQRLDRLSHGPAVAPPAYSCITMRSCRGWSAQRVGWPRQCNCVGDSDCSTHAAELPESRRADSARQPAVVAASDSTAVWFRRHLARWFQRMGRDVLVSSRCRKVPGRSSDWTAVQQKQVACARRLPTWREDLGAPARAVCAPQGIVDSASSGHAFKVCHIPNISGHN